MSTHKKLMTVCAAVVLAFGLAACGSSGDDSTADATVTMPEPMPAPDPVPTDLEATQTAAAAAAAAAMTASDNAAASASSAADATANIATLQTNGMAADHAYAAHKAAGEAAAAASEAAAASADAAAATTGAAAEAAWAMADAAQTAAEAAETTATEMAEAAIAAAMTELHINVKDKNVGDSSVNADAGALSTFDNGNTILTGRMKALDPMRTEDQDRHVSDNAQPLSTPITATVADGAETRTANIARRGVVGVQENPTTIPKEAMDPSPFVEVRSDAIGRTLDTEDDAARLMLITGYLDTKKVKVFAFGPVPAGENIIMVGTGDEEVAPSALTYKGEFYPVVTSTVTAPADIGGTAVPDALDSSDVLLASAKPRKVYSYDSNYYVEHSTATATGGATTTTYRRVIIDVTLAAIDDATDQTTEAAFVSAKPVEVTAEIADVKDYDHIHFGVWATLGAAAPSGAQSIADLGIGFVQNHSGMGMTGADMPNNGSASYKGDWVATVQKESTVGDGSVELEDGAATLTANFDKDEFKAALDGLATLTGTLSENTFSGMTVSAVDHDDLGSSASAFDGSFTGGFYGEKAAEAAGVFDFSSEKMEAGAFRGAFGGTRD